MIQKKEKGPDPSYDEPGLFIVRLPEHALYLQKLNGAHVKSAVSVFLLSVAGQFRFL